MTARLQGHDAAVVALQNPTASLADDVAATPRAANAVPAAA
ncbi:hypothetical protein [Roseomonas rosulenta]|nr:hypothetical protein [Roseomonas rosulenta]